MPLMASKYKPNVSLMAIKRNEAAVCWSWSSSNSFIIFSCKFEDLITAKPRNEAAVCENTGALTKKIPDILLYGYITNVSILLVFAEFYCKKHTRLKTLYLKMILMNNLGTAGQITQLDLKSCFIYPTCSWERYDLCFLTCVRTILHRKTNKHRWIRVFLPLLKTSGNQMVVNWSF